MNPESNTTWTAPKLVDLQHVDQAENGGVAYSYEDDYYTLASPT